MYRFLMTEPPSHALKRAKRTVLSAVLNIYGKTYYAEETLSNTDSDYENECERLLAVALYKCFCRGFRGIFRNGEF